jgi:hypothetical protein
MPLPPVERSVVKEPAPPVICYLGRADTELKFRVEDAFSHQPIGLARIVIENLHLASELGSDSEAVTWSDGCARFTHRFLGLYRRRGKEVSSKRFLQGPWIYVSAEGYGTRKMPLTTVLKEEDLRIDAGWKSAVVVTLEPLRSREVPPGVWTGIYRRGAWYSNAVIRISNRNRFHFESHGDVIHAGDPHQYPAFDGEWRLVEGLLHLIPAGPRSSDFGFLLGNDFVLVPWGGLRFLVAEKDRLAFCSAVNAGRFPYFPCSGLGGDVLEPDRRPPAGVPLVPKEWEPFLLPKPVSGTIDEVLREDLAMVNVGSKAGVQPGMLLQYENKRTSSEVTVLYVEEGRCLVKRMGRDAMQPLVRPEFSCKIGEMVSSRHMSGGPG